MAGAWKLRTGSSVKRPSQKPLPIKKKPVWETLVGWVTDKDYDLETGIESWCKRKYEISQPRHGNVRSNPKKNWHSWEEFAIEPQTKCSDIDDFEAFKDQSLADHFKPKPVEKPLKGAAVNNTSVDLGKKADVKNSDVSETEKDSNTSSGAVTSRPPSQGQACITQLNKPESPVKLCYTQAPPSDRGMSREELISRASKASINRTMEAETVENVEQPTVAAVAAVAAEKSGTISRATDPGPSTNSIVDSDTPRMEETFNRLIAPPCTPKLPNNRCKICDKTPLGCVCYRLEQKSRINDICEDELPVPETIQRHLDKVSGSTLLDNSLSSPGRNLHLNENPFRALLNRTRTNIFPIRDLIDNSGINSSLSAAEKRAIRVQESYARNGPLRASATRNANEKGPFYLTGKDLLQHKDRNLFWLQEGLDMVRFYQKSKYVCPTGFRPAPNRTPLQRSKDIAKRRMHGDRPGLSQHPQYSSQQMFGEIPATHNTHDAAATSYQSIAANYPPDYRGRTDKLTVLRETRSAVDGRHDWRRRSFEEIIEGDIALLELNCARKQLQSTLLPAIRNEEQFLTVDGT